MQNRITSEPDRTEARPRAPLTQRLWRNQLGIAIAIALTLSAIGLLWASFRG